MDSQASSPTGNSNLIASSSRMQWVCNNGKLIAFSLVIVAVAAALIGALSLSPAMKGVIGGAAAFSVLVMILIAKCGCHKGKKEWTNASLKQWLIDDGYTKNDRNLYWYKEVNGQNAYNQALSQLPEPLKSIAITNQFGDAFRITIFESQIDEAVPITASPARSQPPAISTISDWLRVNGFSTIRIGKEFQKVFPKTQNSYFEYGPPPSGVTMSSTINANGDTVVTCQINDGNTLMTRYS